MTGGSLFDPGLQPERTALAWRRTVLSLGLGALVALRLLPPVLGVWSFAAGFAGMFLAGLIWALAGRRARQTHTALLGSPQPLPDGRLPLLLTLVVAGAAVLGILYVVRLP
jgi:putative membrane protein